MAGINKHRTTTSAAVLLFMISSAGCSGVLMPLTDEQAMALRDNCGMYPVSLSRGSVVSVRKYEYLDCKHDTLSQMDDAGAMDEKVSF